MLPPFRIRNLRRSNSTADTDAHSRLSTELGAPDQHGIVQVSAPEYDATISTHPEATLKYMDEDDGEVITVGSSLELAQRLEEPITPTSRSSTKSPPFLYPAMPRPADPRLSTITPYLHTFDIDRTSGALSLWRNIQRRQKGGSSTASSSTTPNWSRPLLVDHPKQSLYKGHAEPLTSDTKVNWTEDPREHYFRSTNPPHLAREGRSETALAAESILRSTDPSSEQSPRMVDPLLRSHSLELAELNKEWGSLSLEGRKQAEEAGLKLGCSIKRPISHSPSEIPQKKAHQDRWAAYSRIKPDPQPEDVNPPSEDKSQGTDEENQSHRPLLEVFEAELSKLLSDGPVPSAAEMIETSNEPQPKPTTEPLTPEIPADHGAGGFTNGHVQDSPVELLGQAVRGFIDGVGLLTSEFRSNIPEAHEQLLKAQQTLPHTVQQTVLGALRGLGSRVNGIANNVQLASIATRNAADRTRGLDTHALEGVVSGLQGLAVLIGDVGGALFPGMTLESTGESSEGQADYTTEYNPAVAEATTPAAATLPHSVGTTVEDEMESFDVATTTSASRMEGSTQSSVVSTQDNGTLDGSLDHARSKYTDGEYEEIHRTKREEAADRREADRQRVRRMQQKADGDYLPSDTSTRSSGREGQSPEINRFDLGQAKKQYDETNDTRAPEPVPEIPDKQNHHSKPYCLFGCTSSSSCRHRRSTGGSPYPSRNSFYRSRHTRRSPIHYTSQLPYEYVVPPPDFYDTPESDLSSNLPRHNGARMYRNRLPATSFRESSQDTSTSPCDWPKVQRYGPIHLPYSTRRPHDNTWLSQLPPSRSPRSLSPPSRWMDSLSPPPKLSTPEVPWMDRPLAPPRQPTSEPPWVHPYSQTPRQPSRQVLWENSCSQQPRQPTSETLWAKARLATTHAAHCPSDSQCGLIPAGPAEGPTPSHDDVSHHTSTLRHRQSWHPSSATKTPDKWDVTRPEKPTVSFAEPSRVSSIPSWNRVLDHRRSTGLATASIGPYSTTRDLPLFVSGVQTNVTQPSGRTNFADPGYSLYQDRYGEKITDRITHGDFDTEKVERMGRDSFEFRNSRASLSSPRNAARHPSPVKRSDLPIRAATVSHSKPNKEQDIFSEIPSLSSVLDSLPPERIAAELKRFPTLAQFESETSKSLPPFPPLPTMEPLIPFRTDAQLKSAQVLEDAAKAENKSDVDTPRNQFSNGRSTQADAPATNESSGEFFRRMTGLGVNLRDLQNNIPQRQPVCPTKVKPEQGDARPARPFDPLADSVTLHRSRLLDDFRRTSTERRSLHDHYAGNRRPYSEYFTGSGRLGWESFLAKQDGASGRVPTTTSHGIPSVATGETIVLKKGESTPPSDASIYTPAEHNDAKTVEKVQECVDQLSSLGFGTNENGGMARLLVYAQAAEGNLEDAIETIEEERKAYEERSQY